MKILLTRPADDSAETAALLAAQGHQALIAPLLTLQFQAGPDVALDGVQAILATSANGIRALARRTPRRDVPVYAVGPQTAAEAQKLGFCAVRSADGNADDLAAAAKAWASPTQGALLHVAGEGNDAKLVRALTGFAVRQEILYGVRPVSHLPDVAHAALARGEVDAALFFSPRSAETFRLCALPLALPLNRVLAACISLATAQALTPLVFARTAIAARPNQTELLALLPAL